MSIVDKVKISLRVTSPAYDDEIAGLIEAGKRDLEISGVTADEDDKLILRAVTTYVRANFGSPDDYDRLKASYDEQKAQLKVATGYTNWGDDA